jgi:hypothetical protein
MMTKNRWVIDNDEIYQIIVTKIFQKKQMFPHGKRE